MKNWILHIKERFLKKRLLFDKMTFLNIFLVWACTVIIFGVVYHVFSNGSSYLFYQVKNQPVASVYDSIYFSFITATTTGFGDIVPIGFFKGMALAEVIFGLLLLAIVTSKLVSIKQDVILDEIYEISFNERISRIRSALILFRQNIGRVLSHVEESVVRKREVGELYLFFSNFEDILNEVIHFVYRPESRIFSKTIDKVNAELLFNSVINSFDKINELLCALNASGVEWKRDTTIFLLDRCINLSEEMFKDMRSKKVVSDQTARNIEDQKNLLISRIREEIGNS
jgi:potassium channel LctB